MNLAQQKLMVLGAGPAQLPLIRTGVELGHFVVTVDYLPENVGHHMSHRSVDCSTVDRDGVLAAAIELGIDGIATLASDVATPTIAYVADRLGLPGPPLNVAETMANKAQFRAFQESVGLPGPRFCVGTCCDDVLTDARGLTFPVVVKPVDTSGSRGVSKVDRHADHAFRRAFAEALRYSPSRTVCVEEFVPGHDVSGDGFVVDRRLRAVVTKKYKRGLMPVGHAVPSHLTGEEQEEVRAGVERVCAALGYENGPLDFDVRLSDEGPTVLEMSARLGGNAIPAVIHHATGVDLVAAVVAYALGGEPRVPAVFEMRQQCASLVLGSDYGGVVTHIADSSCIRERVPEVLECEVDARPGDTVHAFVHSAACIGYAVFRCSGSEAFRAIGSRVVQTLALEVAPTPDSQESGS